MENERLVHGFNWKKLPRYVAIALIIAVGMLLMVRLLDLLMIWGLYSWFFQSIIRVGGINEYFAGAASIWFTAVVLLLLPIALSRFLFRRQVKGLLIISVCFSLWFVILYFLSQPREGEYFNTITGAGRLVWFKNPQGKIRILPLGYKFDPHYGIKTQLITPPVVIDYEKQVGQERQETEKKRTQSIPPQPAIDLEKKPAEQQTTTQEEINVRNKRNKRIEEIQKQIDENQRQIEENRAELAQR